MEKLADDFADNFASRPSQQNDSADGFASRPSQQMLQKRRSTLATLPSLPKFPYKWTPKLTHSDETDDMIREENETDEIICEEEKPSFNGANRRSSLPAIFHWEPKVRSL